MYTFEEEIKKIQNKQKTFVLFTGEQYFSDKLNEAMEIAFLLQKKLYRKKYEKYNQINYCIIKCYYQKQYLGK